jgi:hypothetical protein
VSYPYSPGSIHLKGRQLAVIPSFGGVGVVLDDYVVSNLVVETRCAELMQIGVSFSSHVPTSMSVDIGISSSGPVTTFDVATIKKNFRSVDELEIDDLLKIVYRKMDQRDPEN